jgi:uncharacterized repeat protein (TIGR02543 family)
MVQIREIGRDFVMKKLFCVIVFLLAPIFLFTAMSLDLKAEGEEENVTVKVVYDLGGGFFNDDVKEITEYTFGDEMHVIPDPSLPGYTFDGWYANRIATEQIKDLNDLLVLYPEDDEPYVRLYARWTKIELEVPQLYRIKNLLKGVLTVSFLPPETDLGADGYELLYAYDPTFTDRPKTIDLKTINTAAYLKNKIGERTYYLKARSYRIDSTGEKYYSDYGRSRSIYLANGADEVDPSPDSGTIKSARIEGGSVVVTAEIPERIAGYDDFYYLVKLDPMSNAVIGALSSFEKDEDIVTSFSVSGNLMAKFALAVKETENTYYVMSKPTYIDNPEALASYTAPYPTPASKKGRQGTYDTGIGDKHYFHNLYLEELIGTAGSHDVAYNYNGKTYYFYNPTHHIDYNSDIMAANANGGTVTMQVMIRWGGNSTDMITPTGRTPGYNFYAFNMEEPAAREKVEAAFMFLTEYWSKSNRHVDNWILGNEVNTFLNTTGRWYWAGNISRDAFMTNYSNTFRCLYYAAKSHYANCRVFTCTDHTWNDRDRDWGTRGFITALDSYLNEMNPNIKWNLANHAYTAVLTNADPWNDGKVRIYSVAHGIGASFVSPYNLEVLTNYCASNFGSDCRIILSEVGFSSTNGVNPTLNGGRQAGADVQAAATAYLFFKAQFTGNIDACIFHTGDEGEPGKNFGILGKPAGDVYRYMDTPSYAEHCNGYLGLIDGATSWEQIIPGFNGATLRSMPSR